MEATIKVKGNAPEELNGYHYYFWSVFLLLAIVWVFIGVVTYITCLIIYPFIGYLPKLYSLEFVVIVIATLYIARRLSQQVIFELGEVGIKQGSVYVSYQNIAKIEQLNRYFMHGLYIFEVGKDRPMITVFWPKHIIAIDDAIARINLKTGKKIKLK